MKTYYVAGMPYSDELYHHGIKGQVHGIRRYQNEDGSLTAAGRIRYGVGQAINSVSKAASAAAEFVTGNKARERLQRAQSMTKPGEGSRTLISNARNSAQQIRQNAQNIKSSGEAYASRLKSTSNKYADKISSSNVRVNKNKASASESRYLAQHPEKRLGADSQKYSKMASEKWAEAQKANKSGDSYSDQARNLFVSTVKQSAKRQAALERKSAIESGEAKGMAFTSRKAAADRAQRDADRAELMAEKFASKSNDLAKKSDAEYAKARSAEKQSNRLSAKSKAANAMETAGHNKEALVSQRKADRAQREQDRAELMAEKFAGKAETARRESATKSAAENKRATSLFNTAAKLERERNQKTAARDRAIASAQRQYDKTLPGMAASMMRAMEARYEQIVEEVNDPKKKQKIKTALRKLGGQIDSLGSETIKSISGKYDSMINLVKGMFDKVFSKS